MDEDHQQEAKQQILGRALGRETVPLLPSPKQLGYRKIARLHFDPAHGGLGFRKQKQKTIVDLDACPILDPALNRAFAPLKEQLLPHVDGPAEIRIALGEDGLAVFLETRAPLSSACYDRGAKLVPDPFSGLMVSVEGYRTVIAGSGRVAVEGVDGNPLHIPISSFGQANHGINQRLGQTVGDWIEGGGYRSIMELFAGAGNLTVILANSIRKVATLSWM